MNKKGFTLIELLAVIVILGIVIAIAIPGVNAVITSSRKGTYISEVKMMAEGVSQRFLDGTFIRPKDGSAIYVDYALIENERGGTSTAGEKSTFGNEWETAFFVVHNDGGELKYYFAGRDSANNGNELVLIDNFVKGNIVHTLSSLDNFKSPENPGTISIPTGTVTMDHYYRAS